MQQMACLRWLADTIAETKQGEQTLPDIAQFGLDLRFQFSLPTDGAGLTRLLLWPPLGVRDDGFAARRATGALASSVVAKVDDLGPISLVQVSMSTCLPTCSAREMWVPGVGDG